METRTAAVLIAPLSIGLLFLFGCLGALLVEALKHVRKLQGKGWPDTFEITVSVILLLVGGAVAALYQGQVQSMLIAAQIGASAPAIIGAWASGGSQPPGGSSGGFRVDPASGTAAIAQVDVLSQIDRALSWRM